MLQISLQWLSHEIAILVDQALRSVVTSTHESFRVVWGFVPTPFVAPANDGEMAIFNLLRGLCFHTAPIFVLQSSTDEGQLDEKATVD